MVKLKYLCKSFTTPIIQSELELEPKEGLFPVYGASGLAGYSKTYATDEKYLGIVKDGAGVGRIRIYSEYSSLLGTLAYIVPNEKADIRWLKYAIDAMSLGERIDSTTIPHIYFSEYGNRYVCDFDIEEQERIANYLDFQCAYIDAVIEKTKASIEEYKKLKQAVITQAVTKGIRGDRPMKDSGIEWIGDCPDSDKWMVEKIKYVTTISRGLFNHRPRNDERYYDGDYPFIQTGDVAGATKYIETYSQTLNELGKGVSKEFPRGTLTMTIAANVGDVAILNFDAFFPDSVVGFVPKKGFSTLYLFYVFSAMKEEFVRTAIKSTQLNLNLERVKELFVPVTIDEEEQEEIVSYLENKCSEIDSIINNKNDFLGELEIYKKSLIYEYVTGKKEVP